LYSEALRDRPAALLASGSLAVLETAFKYAFPVLGVDLAVEDAEGRQAAFVDRSCAVVDGVDERLEVRLEEGEEELLGAVQERGDVRQRQKGGEDDLEVLAD
jgi:hypothetical protein